MKQFYLFVLGRRAVVAILVFALFVSGIFAWIHLPIDAFPDVTGVQVMVLTEASGLSPGDMELQITLPLERHLAGLPAIQSFRSISKYGLSQIVVTFQDGTDIYTARQHVFERIQSGLPSLPPGVIPLIAPPTTGLGEVLQYTLESDTLSPMELRTLQDWVVAPQLRSIPGVAEINSFGGFVRQYHIIPDPEALMSHGLCISQVAAAVASGNANAGAGFLLREWDQTYVRTIGQFLSLDDVRNTVIESHNGVPIYLGDLAKVQEGYGVRHGAVTRDAKGEVTAGMVIILPEANAHTVVEEVQQMIPAIERSLPEGVAINVFYNRIDLINASISTVSHALFKGGILVLAVLLLFLGEFRTALAVALALPLTFLGTFIVFRLLGLTANLMTLGGLAFAVGMVVDAATILVENIRRKLGEESSSHVTDATEKGNTRNRNRGTEGPKRHDEIVAESAAEVSRPMLFAQLLTGVVVLPLLTFTGVEGRTFKPLALTLVIAIAASLFLSLFIIPVAARLLVPARPFKESRFMAAIGRVYLGILDKILAHPIRFFLATATVSTVAAALVIPLLGASFLPPLDEGAIAINVVRLPNASIPGAVKTSTALEQVLLKFPEVKTVVAKTGRSEIAEDPMDPNQTDLIVMLHPIAKWETGRRSRDELVEAMRIELEQIPGLRYAFSQPIALRVNELISGIKTDVAVKVFGPEHDVLQDVATQVIGAIERTEGARDVGMDRIAGLETLEINLRRDAMARHGLTVQMLNMTVESAVAGVQVTRFFEGDRQIPVVMRFPVSSREDTAALRDLPIRTPSGAYVSLGEVAQLDRIEAPALIGRELGMRRIMVEANIAPNRDLGGFVKELRAELAQLEANLPAGYFLRLDGQFKNRESAMAHLRIVVPITLILTFILLTLAAGGIRDAGLILLNLPFALVGGMVALGLLGLDISVSAAIAFVVLMGIAVQDGVVLVLFARQQLQGRVQNVTEAIKMACSLRLRPILMTTATSVIGYAPLLAAKGPGADIQRPLAAVVTGGLLTSSLVTLLLIPAILAATAKYTNNTR